MGRGPSTHAPPSPSYPTQSILCASLGLSFSAAKWAEPLLLCTGPGQGRTLYCRTLYVQNQGGASMY